VIDLARAPVVESPLAHAIAVAPAGGYFVEFGVASGRTLRQLAAMRPTIGFDSFAGLPEDWRPEYPRGTFAQKDIPIVPNAAIVVGLFENTLPKIHVGVALAHIDCDLYASAKAALAWVKEHAIPGCVVVFDEFFGYPGAEHHEEKALRESGLVYELLCKSPPAREKIAIRIGAP
jgi:hypothetical protein